MTFLPFSILFFTSFLVCLALATYGWRHRHVPASLGFTFTLLLLCIWPLAAAIDVTTSDLALKIALMKARLIPNTLGPLTWLWMVIAFTNQSHLITRRRVIALCVLPVLTILIILFDPGTLFRYGYTVNLQGPFPILEWSNGPWFYVFIISSYLLYASTFFILARSLRNSSRLIARQSLIVIAATALPLAVEILFQIGITPLRGFNLSPALYSVAGLLLAWGIFGYHLFDIIPIARGLVVDSMTDGMMVLDLNGRIADVNAAAEGMMGISEAKAIAQPIDSPLSTRPDLIERYRDVFQARDEIHVGKGDARRDYELHFSPLKNRRGELLGRVVTMRDVTERVKTEVQLRESEARYRALVELLPAVVYVTAVDEFSHTLYISPQVETVLGFSPKAWGAYQLWSNQLHPDDRARVIAAKEHSVKTGAPFADEYRLYALDGHIVWLQDQAALVRNHLGEASFWHGFLLDITAQKNAAALLQQSENRYKDLVEHAADIIYQIDTDGHFTLVNQIATRIMGYASEELVGKHYLDLIRSDYQQEATRFYGRQFTKKIPGTYFEFPALTKQGDVVWIGQNVQLMTEAGGKVTGMQAVARDITQRKQVEANLERQNKRLSALNQITLQLLTVRDLDELLNTIAHATSELLDAPNATISLGEGDLLVDRVVYPPTLPYQKIATRPGDMPSPLSQVYQTVQPFITEHYSALPNIRPTTAALNLYATILLPIVAGEKCLGVIGCARTRPDYPFDANDLSTGELLAQLAALAIINVQLYTAAQAEIAQRVRAEHDLRNQKKLFEDLVAVARATAKLPTLVDTLDNALGTVATLTGAESSTLFLLDAEGKVTSSTLLRKQVAPAEQHAQLSTVLEGGLLGWIVRHKQSTIINDTAQDERWIATSASASIRSVLSVPILVADDLQAVLVLYHSKVNHFTATHQEFIEAAVAQLSLAIRNAQIFEAQGRLLSRQIGLYNVLAAVSRENKLQGVTNTAVKTISRLGTWANVGILLQGVNKQEWQYVSNHGVVEQMDPADEYYAGLVQRALTTHGSQYRPLISPPEPNGSMEGSILSEIIVPLRLANESVGALFIASQEEDGFEGEDLQLAEFLAEAISLAVNQVQLLSQERDLTAQLTAARTQLDDLLHRFLSGAVADHIIAHPDEAKPGGERLYVTVMFADLQGFTRWSEGKSPEVILEMLNRHLANSVEMVIAEGGTLDKFMGDGFMATFNAPSAQSDHAERAVRAAKAILGTLSPDSPLQFRMGINTGLAIVGNVGSARLMNFTVIGDTVNVAKRLQEMAQPGQILITEATHAWVQNTTSTFSLGGHALRGRTQEIEVFRVL